VQNTIRAKRVNALLVPRIVKSRFAVHAGDAPEMRVFRFTHNSRIALREFVLRRLNT
jgi:hypothetical protein